MNFGKLLRQLRKEKGLTQAELAKLISIGESTVSFYESGKRQPDYETLIRLANIFRVSVDQLLGRQKINTEIYPNHFHNQSLSYLLGEDEAKSLPLAEASITYLTHLKEPTLTKQDREELKRDAEYIKNAMMNVTGLAFNNKPQDDETLEKVMAALEEAMILARKEAQKKYTPKKYRKKEE